MSNIRPAAERDIPRILDLLVQVCMVHHNGRPDLFNGPATKYTAEELQTLIRDPSRPIFVWADENDAVQGYAFCIHQQHVGDHVLTDIRTLYIDDICVDENARRMHVGSDLYRHVLDYARSEGFYNVTLNVWSCNPGAQAFYERMGMTPQKICMEQIL